jgi:hypothetical protein
MNSKQLENHIESTRVEVTSVPRARAIARGGQEVFTPRALILGGHENEKCAVNVLMLLHRSIFHVLLAKTSTSFILIAVIVKNNV